MKIKKPRLFFYIVISIIILGLIILFVSQLNTNVFTNHTEHFQTEPLKLSVIGPFNSGTNLMQNVINNNLDNNSITYPFWKHSFNLEHLEKNREYIVMYRHPYLWINSLKKANYDIKFDSIDTNVIFKLYRNVETEITEDFDLPFNNLVEIWNMYYNFYIDLLKKHKFNLIFIDYCKLVGDNNYEYVNNQCGNINIDEKTFYNTLNTPAKKHGNPNNKEKAIYKCLNNAKLLDDYEKNIVKKYIDKRLVDYFNIKL